MGRTNNSIRNAISGFLLQGITAVLSFVIRSTMISTLGIESVAINGLFSEVIAALSLAELGISSAIIYNLFKPLAEQNTKKINQLMNLFRKAYRIIAFCTMVLGIILCPWIQRLVNGLQYDIWYLRLIYLLFVFQCSTSYLFAYKGALLNADQKSREVSKITAFVKIIGTIIQIMILYFTKKYICFLVTSIVINLSINIITSFKVDKLYPYLSMEEELDREERKVIFSNIKNIFFKQLAGKIVDSTDNMLISTLAGTILVGYYANYLSIISVIKQFGLQISNGLTASVGNLFVSESKDKCEEILDYLEALFRWMAMVLSVCTFGCIQIVISLWIGEKYLLASSILIWCCINMYCSIAITPLSIAMHVIGQFEIGRKISMLSAGVNLLVSFVLGRSFGMTGIFIGTFCTYFIEFFVKNYYLFKLFFRRSSAKNICKGIISFSSTAILIIFFYLSDLNNPLNLSLTSFFIRGFIGAGLSIFMIILMNFKSKALRYWFDFGKRILSKKKIDK